jgi:hypothetical protein
MKCPRHRDVADDSTLQSNANSIAVDLQSLPILVDRIFDLLMPFQEPPVPEGKKRVRWICVSKSDSPTLATTNRDSNAEPVSSTTL